MSARKFEQKKERKKAFEVRKNERKKRKVNLPYQTKKKKLTKKGTACYTITLPGVAAVHPTFPPRTTACRETDLKRREIGTKSDRKRNGHVRGCSLC